MWRNVASSYFFAKNFQANTIVEDLDLSDNHLGDELGEKLLSFLKENGFVSHLNLSLNFLASKSIEKLSRMMTFNTSVKWASERIRKREISDLIFTPLLSNIE